MIEEKKQHNFINDDFPEFFDDELEEEYNKLMGIVPIKISSDDLVDIDK